MAFSRLVKLRIIITIIIIIRILVLVFCNFEDTSFYYEPDILSDGNGQTSFTKTFYLFGGNFVSPLMDASSGIIYYARVAGTTKSSKEYRLMQSKKDLPAHTHTHPFLGFFQVFG